MTNFIDTNPDTVLSEAINFYQNKADKILAPAQAESLMIETVAYTATLNRIAANEAAKQNLLEFAKGAVLDYKGKEVGLVKLAAQSALTTIQFELDEIQPFDVLIPISFPVPTKDGKMDFLTLSDAVIPKGQLSVTVEAIAEFSGIEGNGYLANEIYLESPLPNVSKAFNITKSEGGADEESEDSFRERIYAASESFSTAGAKGAYIFHAKSAHQDIIDVEVYSPIEPITCVYKINGVNHSAVVNANTVSGFDIVSSTLDRWNGNLKLVFSSPVSEIDITIPRGGKVNVHPLMKSGNPTNEILNLVSETLNDEKVIPLTDFVNVLSPEKLDFSINADIVLFQNADQELVLAKINELLNIYTAESRQKLGKSIIRSKIISIINSVEGVYSVVLNSPTLDLILEKWQWANCVGITVNSTGRANE